MMRCSACRAALAGAALLTATGCSPMGALKSAYYEFKGAGADLKINQAVDDRTLATYDAVDFDAAHTTLGEKLVSRALLAAYDRATRTATEKLREEGYGGDANRLRVSTEFIYCQEKGLLSAGLAIARVKISGASQLVLDAIVKAESRAFTRGGEDDLAEASVRAVQKYLRKHKQAGLGEPESEAR